MYMLATSFVGIRLAVWVNGLLFRTTGDHAAASSTAGDLYISIVFVSSLSIVSVSMLRDVADTLRAGRKCGANGRVGTPISEGPSQGTVLVLFTYGSSGRRVVTPVAGRFTTSTIPVPT